MYPVLSVRLRNYDFHISYSEWSIKGNGGSLLRNAFFAPFGRTGSPGIMGSFFSFWDYVVMICADNVKHDRSLFERECDAFGKVDGAFLIR